LADAHHEFLARLFDIAVNDDSVFVQRREGNVLHALGIAARCSEASDSKDEECDSQAFCRPHWGPPQPIFDVTGLTVSTAHPDNYPRLLARYVCRDRGFHR